jgi:hypothetical protein
MAINNEQPVTTNCTLSSMLNKILQPSYTNFISSPAVISYSYPLVLGVVVVPALVIVLPLEDEERRDKPATSVDRSNQGNPLAITKLTSNWVELKL